MQHNGKVIQFHNCKIARNGKIIKEDLWTRNGKIIDPEPLFFDEKNYADVRINCSGALISPGFIDLQINGNLSVQKIIILISTKLIYNSFSIRRFWNRLF